MSSNSLIFPTTRLFQVRMIVDVSKSVLVLSTQAVIKLLRSKEASNVVDVKSWPVILDTDDMPKKKLPVAYRAPTAEMLAYLDFSVSTTGMLAGIKMSHAAVTNLCKSMKLACELYPSRHIALCLDPYCGLGFALWCVTLGFRFLRLFFFAVVGMTGDRRCVSVPSRERIEMGIGNPEIYRFVTWQASGFR